MENITISSVNMNKTESVTMETNEIYATVREALLWSSLVIVLVAIFGNTLIIIVMSKSSTNRNAIGVFLMALAVSDMLYMLNIPFLRWMYREFGISYYVANTSFVATSKFVANYTFKALSAWMLSCVTLVRTFAVAMPFKVTNYCNTRTASVIVIALCACIIVSYSLMFTLVISYGFESGSLIVETKVEQGLTLFKWIDLTFAFVMPLVIISIGSIIISVHMRRRKNIQSTNTRHDSVTRTLLAANITFILTMCPATLTTLVCQNNQCGLTHMQYAVVFDVLLFIYDLNSTLNFYVYYISGTKFRSDVKKVFQCFSRHPVRIQSTEERTMTSRASR